MTYTEAHREFRILLDKQPSTSMPSFTNAEIDVFLNKAYNMVINRRFTGLNMLRQPFEQSVKRISDFSGLVVDGISRVNEYRTSSFYENSINFIMPSDFLFWVSAGVIISDSSGNSKVNNVQLVPNDSVRLYGKTDINNPWIPSPVACLMNMESKDNSRSLCATVYYDRNSMIESNESIDSDKCIMNITYVKTPRLVNTVMPSADDAYNSFEVSDNVVIDIISQAVIIAIDNIESQRINSNLEINKTID